MNGMTCFVDLKKLSILLITGYRFLIMKRWDSGGNNVIMKNYLHNREQCVKNNNGKSQKSTIIFGAPQESVLGPLLFLLYL